MKKVKSFSVERVTSFSGRRKVGIDTNILIKLYTQPFLFDYEHSRIFRQDQTVFTHSICVWELTKHLMKTKNLSEIDAKAEAKSFSKSKNIKTIYYNLSRDEIKSFENQINSAFQSQGKDNLHLHYPDSLILLSFKKFGVNKVISDDWSFREAVKQVGIDSERLPSIDNQISRELKKLFGKRKK